MTNMIKTYGKALAAVLFAIVTVLHTTLSDGHVNAVEWVQIAIAATTAVGVWFVPIHPDWPAKTGIATLLAVLNALTTLIIGGISASDLTELVLAALTVLTVGAAPAVSTLRKVGPPPAGGRGEVLP